MDYDDGRPAGAGVPTQHCVEDTLDLFAENTRNLLPGFDGVSVSTLDDAGQVCTHASTGELVSTLDRLQHRLGEGPSVDTLRGTPVVLATRLGRDARWPRYVSTAVRCGLQAQVSASLSIDDERPVGALNIYSTTCADLDPAAAVIARILASQLALTLRQAREADLLREAVVTQQRIDLAVGLLMSEHRLTEEAAFDVLLRRSRNQIVQPGEVAAELVQDANWAGFTQPRPEDV